MASSPGIIPRDKLKLWEVFRDVGPEAEEILKTVKLVHVFSKEEAFVVTTTDETYYFSHDGGEECEIIRILNLCGVRVKEFVVFIMGDCLAMTEDGSLYCFDLSLDPRLVGGTLTGKRVQQVALAQECGMALTVGGDVYHWFGNRDTPLEPILIPKKIFDYQEVISLACIKGTFAALTSNGELFQWGPENKLPQKVAVGTAPLKKIIAISHLIFALTVEGSLYWVSKDRRTNWTVALENLKFRDITTSGMDDVVVAELKNKVHLALSYRGRSSHPQILSISPNVTSLDELFAQINQTTWRTIRAQNDPSPGTVRVDIGNLWGNKENVDVTFSVGGKTISAHKLILTSRSEYFANMFSNEWKEARAGCCIEIKDTKFEIFEALLFYIYCDTIFFSKSDYENVFGLMKLADAHCAVKIRQECEEILMENITAENAVFLVRNAASANAWHLERNVVRFILDNRLLDVNLSPREQIDFLGEDAFQKFRQLHFVECK